MLRQLEDMLGDLNPIWKRMRFAENVVPDAMEMVDSGVTAWYWTSNGWVRGKVIVCRFWIFGRGGHLLLFHVQFDTGETVVRRGCSTSELHVAGAPTVKAKLIFGLVVSMTFPAGKANLQVGLQLGERGEALFV